MLLSAADEMAEGNLNVTIQKDLGIFSSLGTAISRIQKGFKKLEDAINASFIDFRYQLPEDKVCLMLDSEKTYRIIENLMINITKYALPHSRAYIELCQGETDVTLTMKNISAAELNFSIDEITDRFVRGDKSRSTEGSGLGLAIVKSFTELQGGRLTITTDGDLFKASVRFPVG